MDKKPTAEADGQTRKPTEKANTAAPGAKAEKGAGEPAAAREGPSTGETAEQAVDEAIEAEASEPERHAAVEDPDGPPAMGGAAGEHRGAAWGEPFARFERRWTWLETRLITFVLLWQLFALVSWVLLGGLSSPPSAGNSAGTIFRGAVGAIVLGLLGWRATKPLPLNVRRAAAIAGIVIGIGVAPAWRAVGIEYFDNMKGWLQEGSTLTLMGGLRGLATRLTLWLALLGASLATAAGKHIHVDVIFRFLPPKLRVPAAIVNFSAAALVCFAAVWGFFDHIAIEDFGAGADQPASAKIATVGRHLEEHAFLTRKQIGLDLRSLPHVLAGDRYDRWMSSAEWNEWVRDAGFESHYSADEIKTVVVAENSVQHMPLVVAPDGETTRGILIHALNLVFCFGLGAIGVRFLLRIALAASGHIDVHPDAAHDAGPVGATTPRVATEGGR